MSAAINPTTTETFGIMLVNTGTPSAPSAPAVREYLREFLGDKQVVQLPRLLWLPILYGIILPLRPRRTAKLYQKIWQPEGSPMRIYMMQLANKLEAYLKTRGHKTQVAIGMNYGSPGIKETLENFQKQHIQKVIILPLYPQFSTTTTESALAKITRAASNNETHRFDFLTIKSYADHNAYIQTLASSVKAFWENDEHGEHLLMSFHGIPKRYTLAGDPYQSQCEQTANLLANTLELKDDEWTLCYQSRFGYNQWLKPATPEVLRHLLQKGIRRVDVICPGFPVDCLETLEEIALRAQEDFIAQGGERLHYIPALNATEMHLKMVAELLQPYLESKKTHRPC